jgi:hypothetical protein
MRTDFITARTCDDLSLHHCKTFVDEVRDHGAIKSMGKDEQFLRDATRKARE